MTLSDLVTARNRLQQFSVSDIQSAINSAGGHLNSILDLPMHSVYKEGVDNLVRSLDTAEGECSRLEQNLSALIDKINEEINELSKNFLARGYIINDSYASNSTDVDTERASRQMHITDDTRADIVTKIIKYTDWHYPALEIGPGDGVWTEHMVAADPLYLVDVHQEFLDATLAKFNPSYQARLRPYHLNGWADGGWNPDKTFDLSVLPQNQIGFVFAWNVFDYFPLAETTKYLQEVFAVLRPGGTMMFSYNNCDVPQCAKNAEIGFKSWMPESLLVKTCRDIGFEITCTSAAQETIHYIEIRKPGELKTVKAHQVLGKIINA